MEGSLDQSSATEEKALNVFQASRALGEALVETPVYQNFLSALKAINNDPEIQRIATQMRSHQNALQMGIGGADHQTELSRLQVELEALPIVQEYCQTENEALAFFRAVDDLISGSIGFPFAHNAHRSSCNCEG